ncbi:hypothetical protein ANN_08703 [Periplaneta americana]|uniref:Per a allergen n=1 Tax=Periplaneta americana TaxID=6978 RepID=A0ABQ8T2T5_PERAM|nr:hypothetical protein ANN_08703 [Periplaneta americana]
MLSVSTKEISTEHRLLMDEQSLKFFQENLQHSRAATSNIAQLIIESRVDISLLQEPYTVNNKIAGIPKSMRTYVCGEGRRRAAIIISNNNVDATLISQLSNEDCVVMEIHHKEKKFFISGLVL